MLSLSLLLTKISSNGVTAGGEAFANSVASAMEGVLVCIVHSML